MAVTTFHLPRARQKATVLGFTGYWLKPIEPRALVRDVRQILGSAEAGRVSRSWRMNPTLEGELR